MASYLIENANILKEKYLDKASLLIKNNRIVSVSKSCRKLTVMKMDANKFIMTPSHIIYDSGLPLSQPFQDMKNYFTANYLLKGCTALMTAATVRYENELAACLKNLRTSLLNSPVDMIVAVKIPPELLTPTFIRKCKKERIPAIFVEINREKDISLLPWGWIREAMFPYNSPLIPVFSEEAPRKRNRLKDTWKQIMLEEKIPAIDEEISVNEPISQHVLAKIGIYPLKSYLNAGGELSYNLYWKSREIQNIEESSLYHHHNHRLAVTVHRGTVIRAGADVLFRPGFGEHVTIKTPSFFAAP
ncbi:hypothetical protein CVD25_05385 [Bacillus canaveralius]|uniref:Uncharacterized protein n=1 Tax=Bacillus canaveralius TaxID=1403243 RepID=A0A2N5GRS1_9BACI|nr:hypothetical protein [Bacillus canaveralius]PLR86146.1 hypothetical protein CU635_03675 [Bacillus canaveralius]PLS00266.1 hypothetical protein CVD25_05385 [Bacillus canaveralius]